MKIKKTNKYIASSEIETIHVFEVNGKKVHVSHWVRDGEENDNVGADIEVLGSSALTDAEYEALGLDIELNLDMDVGTEKEVNDN